MFSQLLPTMEGFDPEAYLAVFHENTSATELAIGAQTLEKELGEGAGQLKQLVRKIGRTGAMSSCRNTSQQQAGCGGSAAFHPPPCLAYRAYFATAIAWLL